MPVASESRVVMSLPEPNRLEQDAQPSDSARPILWALGMAALGVITLVVVLVPVLLVPPRSHAAGLAPQETARRPTSPALRGTIDPAALARIADLEKRLNKIREQAATEEAAARHASAAAAKAAHAAKATGKAAPVSLKDCINSSDPLCGVVAK